MCRYKAESKLTITAQLKKKDPPLSAPPGKNEFTQAAIYLENNSKELQQQLQQNDNNNNTQVKSHFKHSLIQFLISSHWDHFSPEQITSYQTGTAHCPSVEWRLGHTAETIREHNAVNNNLSTVKYRLAHTAHKKSQNTTLLTIYQQLHGGWHTLMKQSQNTILLTTIYQQSNGGWHTLMKQS